MKLLWMSLKDIKYRDSTENKISIFEEDKKNGLTIILLPALGMRASYYDLLARGLAKIGFYVVTADWRGHGYSSIKASRKVDFGYKEFIFDVKELILKVKEWNPNSSILLFGHSLGGQIATLLLARFPNLVDGMMLITCALMHIWVWEKRYYPKLMFAGLFFHPLSKILGYFPGDKIGFGGREARTVIKDWNSPFFSGRYNISGSEFNYEKAIKGISKPILSISIENDKLASIGAIESYNKKFTSSNKFAHVHATRATTGISSINHFNWAKSPSYFCEVVNNWALENFKIED